MAEEWNAVGNALLQQIARPGYDLGESDTVPVRHLVARHRVSGETFIVSYRPGERNRACVELAEMVGIESWRIERETQP